MHRSWGRCGWIAVGVVLIGVLAAVWGHVRATPSTAPAGENADSADAVSTGGATGGRTGANGEAAGSDSDEADGAAGVGTDEADSVDAGVGVDGAADGDTVGENGMGDARLVDSDEVADAVARVEDARVRSSSSETFLLDLARGAGSSLTAGVTWEDDEDIPGCAASVLEQYQTLEGCELACGGYLGIAGNAWGAVLWCPPDWVDVVYITVPEEGEASTVRIVRLIPGDEV